MIRIFILSFACFFYANLTIAQTEPSSQPTAINFLGIKSYGVSVNFSSSDANNYLILRSNQTITDIPIDGTIYEVGEWIGNAKVVSIGANTLHTIRESIANTAYHFAIYAFNDGSLPNYKTDNPLIGSVTTLGKNIGTYYNNYRIDTDDAIDDLTNLLKVHSDLLYGDYRDVVENVLERDTTLEIAGVTENRKYIIGEYSNILHVYEDDIDFSDYNREHVLPRSWMPTDPPSSDNDLLVETSDYHNLFLVKASVNQILRSNHTLDEVDNSGTSEGDCKNGNDLNGDLAFEPREDIKGNAARAMFYTIITYDGKSGSWAFDNLQSKGAEQDVDLLVQWHLQDPVDNFEIARNEYIYNVQNNRNPFVDFPEWVNCIDFKTLTLNGTCPLDTAAEDSTNISINVLYESDNVAIYPNPLKSKGFVKMKTSERIQDLYIENLNGQAIEFSYEILGNIANFELNSISQGVYVLNIRTDEKNYFKKLIIK